MQDFIVIFKVTFIKYLLFLVQANIHHYFFHLLII